MFASSGSTWRWILIVWVQEKTRTWGHVWKSSSKRLFFLFWIFWLQISTSLEVALPQSLKTTTLFPYWSSPGKTSWKLACDHRLRFPAPILCSSLQHWDLTLSTSWSDPWRSRADSRAACVMWDFPAPLAKPCLVLTDISLVSPLLILLLPVCSLFFSYHEMLFPKAPSFVLFSLYFHTFPAWALCLYYELYTETSRVWRV